MPTISSFLGIVIRMYYRDHPPPLFHAFYQEHEVKISITKATPGRDRATGVKQMLHRIVQVTPLPNYALHVEFQNGVSGTVDLSRDLYGDMFEPLRDEAMFRQVCVDEIRCGGLAERRRSGAGCAYLEITRGARQHVKPLIAEPGTDS
jgi:hypothetical protein